MCGIIGSTGAFDVKNVLIEGLRALEYRGYDSAGIAFNDQNMIRTIKSTGKVSDLANKLEMKNQTNSSCGIGHTRWATHGGVTDSNSHPHTYGGVTLIHNGIIENYHELEMELASTGRKPASQTDSEIIALLLDYHYTGNAHEAITKTVNQIEGAYAFCIMFHDQLDIIYCIRNASPLVACHTREGSLIASDMVALMPYTKDYFVLPEGHIATLKADGIDVISLEGVVYQPTMIHVNWDVTAAQKGGYAHFMLKEIYEQPSSIHATIMPRIMKNDLPDFTMDEIPDELFTDINRIMIVACGTAMHAGLVGKSLLERKLRIPVTVEIASEFRYQDPIIDEKSLVITISQSGETADTLAALRLAKGRKSPTLSIVNVKGSSIARESDYVLYTQAGPEIAVASTKAYTAQLSCLYLLLARIGLVRNILTEEECRNFIIELKNVIPAIEQTLSYDQIIEKISKDLVLTNDLFFIGRGLDYALSCEGSIKLKEISYIHSEAYAAGELKHGTLSLIVEGIPVIALATQGNVYSKMISNIREVKARGAMVILITNDSITIDDTLSDYHITLPKLSDEFTPFAAAIILQLIAYYTCLHRGYDVDQPRNLAKSVTVE